MSAKTGIPEIDCGGSAGFFGVELVQLAQRVGEAGL
jgi:hypothetical protein